MHKSKVKYLKVKNSNHETNQRRIQGGGFGAYSPPLSLDQRDNNHSHLFVYVGDKRVTEIY